MLILLIPLTHILVSRILVSALTQVFLRSGERSKNQNHLFLFSFIFGVKGTLAKRKEGFRNTLHASELSMVL